MAALAAVALLLVILATPGATPASAERFSAGDPSTLLSGHAANGFVAVRHSAPTSSAVAERVLQLAAVAVVVSVVSLRRPAPVRRAHALVRIPVDAPPSGPLPSRGPPAPAV